MGFAKIELLNCPFCGNAPRSTGRPATPAEQFGDERFVHYISCYCGGHSATAHKMGSGRTERNAERDAAAKWNTRNYATAKAAGMREAAKIAADMWVGWFQHPAPIAVCVSINAAILKAAEMVEAGGD